MKKRKILNCRQDRREKEKEREKNAFMHILRVYHEFIDYCYFAAI